MLKTTIQKLTRRSQRQERGQIFLMVALMLTILCGMAAFAVDYGSYATERRDLQNAADAIALAAAQELPNSSSAQSAANQWAIENDIDPSLMTVTIIPQSPPSQLNPEVQVEIEDVHEFYFARAVGIADAAVSARASAIKTSPAGGDGVIPLAVTTAAINGVGVGEDVVLKYDSNDITTGNTGPVVLDGTGSGNCSTSDSYCDGLQFGSDGITCAAGVGSEYCDGPSTVDTQPGNLIGATRTAIQWRLDNTTMACDDFDEVFEDDPNSSEPDVYRLTNACNPFLASTTGSNLVLIVPVINELCNGSCSVTIVTYALFFLEGFGNGGCTGNDCEIIGQFVQVNQNVGLLAGTFDPDAHNSFIRLIE